MSDFEIAIQRMSAWLRDYGGTKPREFVGDCAILLLAAKDLAEAQQKLSAAQAIIDRLPKTADGVPVVPGMAAYSIQPPPAAPTVWDWEVVADDTTKLVSLEDGQGSSEFTCLLYSTRAAAEAAKEKANG
jgi:hypothetical protein